MAPAPASTRTVSARLAPPRIVFFGPPGSGKSVLLELVIRQLVATPGTDAIPLAHGPGTQATLRRELIPFQVLVDNPALPGGAYQLIDCDGQAAGELLAHANLRVRGAARGALAEAVRTADALVLVVDANADLEVIDQTFQSFGQFLAGLEEGRLFGREVGGLPVFLTLTKCDALATPDQSPTDWLERIETRQGVLRSRFVDYFGDDVVDNNPSPFQAFGSLDLHPAATARQTPPGAMFEPYADPDGSFGVGQLVREVLPAATAYRERVLTARRRLRWLVTGSTIFVAMVLLGLLVLGLSGRFGHADQLAQRIRQYQANEAKTADRLADRNYARIRKELLDIRSSAGFNGLPPDLRAFVDDRLDEFHAYRDYRNRFKPPRLGPAEIQTAEQARQLEADLQGDLAPPAPRATAWAETEAVRLAKKWQADLALVREAETTLHNWYRVLIRRGNQLLLTTRLPEGSWRAETVALLADAESPPLRPDGEFERSPTVPILRGRKLTHAAAFGFESVTQAQRDWDDTRDRLRHLRDLTDALGLTASGTLAVLDLPEPIEAGVRDLGALRLAALTATYPSPTGQYTEWSMTHFPDPIRQTVGLRLRSVFETGVRHVRKILLAAHGPGPESLETWRRLSATLLTEPDLQAWGRLLGLLRNWTEPGPSADPVQELVEFLRRDRFEMNLRELTITIPDDLLDQRASPSGRFQVTVTASEGPPVVLAFKLDGDPRRDRGTMIYSFVADGHSGTLSTRPGDVWTADLTLRAGADDYRLVWSSSRSTLFQLECLQQPARLARVGPFGIPGPATGVRLQVLPPDGLPLVPVLLPDLRR